ncbi:MAG: rRNA pseudouridine synthase [Clostridia bacterium]|nr:rRNA pseudouridine synthase [Clostridia bacterium]
MIKLQKYFTDCGILSRRAAEEEIRQGHIKVNGSVAELGLRIDPERDIVEYRGKLVKPTVSDKLCLMLNKPRGVVTTLSDEKGRPTVATLVSDAGRRVYPIGRLDMDSDGLLLLTDDGELANRLTHPRHEISKLYRVTVRGGVSDELLGRLNQSMTIDGYDILPVKTVRISSDADKTLLEMELFEGRNRQIRKMCAEVGLSVLRLQRIAIGDLKLGSLPQGTWRPLTDEELAYLRGENKTILKK